MGTWSAAIDGNDTFLDIYSTFYQFYNEGKSPGEASNEVLEDFGNEFEDIDTQNNALFALAMAQWETKAQDDELLDRVKQLVISGKDLEVWTSLGADAKMLDKRKVVLNTFLEKIAKPKDKPKRRIKQKLEFAIVTLVYITAPDASKKFTINEDYTNGVYIHTIASVMWEDEGGTAFAFENQGQNISARWVDSQTLEVTHDADIRFSPKWDHVGFYNDKVKVTYITK